MEPPAGSARRRALAKWVFTGLLFLVTSQFFSMVHAAKKEEKEEVERYPVAEFEWEEVRIPITITIWIFVACVAKIIFHIYKQVSEMFPDSSLLILVGLIIGITLNTAHVDRKEFYLSSQIFMLYLLPPLVFDAGYNMPARAFFDNFGSCLTFALVGTAWNIVAITSKWGLVDLLLFGSLIADVDPGGRDRDLRGEMNVNELLFISVFGESLLNDGVSVVLYNMFSKFVEMGEENLITVDYVNGGLSFFVVALGGTGIGLLFAMLTAFVTKYTDKVPILNPVFVFLIPFASYLVSEMISLSAILAIVFCGAAMKSCSPLASETVIFIFLGLSTVSADHHWDTAFIVLTVIFCVLYRTLVHHFVRRTAGAIAYGLVVALPDSLPAKKLYVTACIVVIYFTGILLKPIASFLQVERKIVHEKGMLEKVHENLIDNTMIGIELVIGKKGHHWIRNTFDRWNAKFFRPLLVKKRALKTMDNTNLVRAANRLAAKDALNFADQVQTWYDVSRSRGSSVTSLPPNGSVMRSDSLIEEEISDQTAAETDENPNLPSILKSEVGDNRFARF
ncbi:Sodium/hydrogen exchanger [Aphelenchoides fujianensis]|nr:Sodium/hydrogen exchanger [Aphelenchoides fujianensis]